ncbi:uncharacterized protein IL334_004203 [Kwoniella shivajii]|uniref:F-box domain-containing protein n=1 Tax=Kwoniella shivajii TaxID=564305 RepID=A0ABZ1CZQ0_9TREE|nr:hypothetical protein IL334_004203 [Kwoniella shivajii]
MMSNEGTTTTLLPELFRLVAIHLAQTNSMETLSSLSRTSKSMNHLLFPVLYHHLTLADDNVEKVFRGVSPFDLEEQRKNPLENFKDSATSVRSQWSLWPDIPVSSDQTTDKAEHRKGECMSFDLSIAKICSICAGTRTAVIQMNPFEERRHADRPLLHHSLFTVHLTTTAVTRNRKLNLLSHVRAITFNTLPSWHICNSLLSLKDGELDQSNPHYIFPNAKQLLLTSNFTYELSDWLNRNWISPRRDNIPRHPMIDFLLISIPEPGDVIIEYPTYTSQMKKAFLQTRYGSKEVVRRCGAEQSRSIRMRGEWELFIDQGIHSSLMPLLWHWRLKTLVFKNVRRSFLPNVRCSNVRVEFAPNEVKHDKDVTEERDIERRVEQILTFIEPDNEAYKAAAEDVKSWEFVSPKIKQQGLVEQMIRDELDKVKNSRVLFVNAVE